MMLGLPPSGQARLIGTLQNCSDHKEDPHSRAEEALTLMKVAQAIVPIARIKAI
jgi:hypothetical protein